KSSISSAVKQLESLLGTSLLLRSTRSVQMTHDGLVFYERCKDLLADMDELQTLFHNEETTLTGRVRIDLPVGIARSIVIPHLPEFSALHPQLRLEISSTDRLVDLIREGFDCVMRIAHLDDSNLVARPLGQLRQINCASPAYLQKQGTPTCIADLKQHQLIHYASNFASTNMGFEYLENGERKSIKMQGNITVNNSDAYQAAALAGLGIIQAPDIALKPWIALGHLVEILDQTQAPALPISLLYPSRRHISRRVRLVMEWLAQIMHEHTSPTKIDSP
ncbi:MAG: LysR family transcriptional regulator, partial [Undibacterium sp.]|nr:LysR family transcriptional regulator [Undibacterium sp.]